MQKFVSAGLSLPKELMKKIDLERGDIPRSRYLLRLLERIYAVNETSCKVSHFDKMRTREASDHSPSSVTEPK